MNSSDDIFDPLNSDSSDKFDDILDRLESTADHQGKKKKNKKRQDRTSSKAKEKLNRLVMGCYIRGVGLVLTCLLAGLMRRGEAKLLDPVEYWAIVAALGFWGLYGVVVIIGGFFVSKNKKYLSLVESLLGGVQIGALCMTVLGRVAVPSQKGELVQAENLSHVPVQRCSDTVAVQ